MTSVNRHLIMSVSFTSGGLRGAAAVRCVRNALYIQIKKNELNCLPHETKQPVCFKLILQKFCLSLLIIKHIQRGGGGSRISRRWE